MSKILKVLKGPLSTFSKNRNGRVYSKKLWENVLNSEYWHDMISNNTMCGEIVHPGDRTESDVYEIDARNISHRVKEAHIEGNKLMGTIEVLDTKSGRELLDLIEAGCTVGISARGMGDVIGDEVDPDTYNFKCFDMTMRPSDPNARLVPLNESEKVQLVLQESEITDILIEGTTPYTKHDRTKEDILSNIVTRLNNINEEDRLTFKPSGRGIQAKLDGENFGNIFVSLQKNDDNNYQIDTYRIFNNKDRSFGYENIPSRGPFSTSEYDRIAKKLLNSFISKIPKEDE